MGGMVRESGEHPFRLHRHATLVENIEGLGATQQLTTEVDVGPDRHVARQGKILIDRLDTSRPRFGGGREIDRRAFELDGATVRAEDGAEDTDQRRFAGTVVADQPRDLPGDDVDRDIVERDHAAEPLADMARPQGRRDLTVLV